MIGLLMMGVVGFVGCGGDKDSPTGPTNEVTKGPEGQTLEIKTEEWDNGNIKVEFQYYRDGGSVVKHGFYKEYDENGTLRLDGTYFEDKEKYNGKWVSYYSDGQIESEENYVDGKRDAKQVEVYNGEDEDGSLIEYQFYRNGNELIKHGYYKEYHENGKVSWEKNYVDGKLDGKDAEYDEEGNKFYEICHEMGEKVDCP
jgi:antitoxin component YwqK of YwqJK toxin-antitoxin module